MSHVTCQTETRLSTSSSRFEEQGGYMFESSQLEYKSHSCTDKVPPFNIQGVPSNFKFQNMFIYYRTFLEKYNLFHAESARNYLFKE